MRIDDSSIRVNRHTCIACGICVDRCIMDNLRLSVAPCRQVCPLDMNCQGYVRLLAMGKETQAIEQLAPFGPFVRLISETCHAPCEKVCARSKQDGAVHILALKQYLARKYPDQLNHISIPSTPSGKRVVVIGTGIPGLASAFRALQAGHAVTLFAKPSDAQARPDELISIITALENAGTVFQDAVQLKEKHGDLKNYDAIILSNPEDQNLLVPGVIENVSDTSIDPVSHLIHGHIFCAETGSSGKEVVARIAAAFETVESVNRFFTNEPFDWGRGLYTQGGAVKAYRPDPRVGSDVERASQEEAAKGFDQETAQRQASRCFGCGRAFEKNQTCWYCLPCELECPQEALNVEIPYLVR